jgi:hypothetical protein
MGLQRYGTKKGVSKTPFYDKNQISKIELRAALFFPGFHPGVNPDGTHEIGNGHEVKNALVQPFSDLVGTLLTIGFHISLAHGALRGHIG